MLTVPLLIGRSVCLLNLLTVWQFKKKSYDQINQDYKSQRLFCNQIMYIWFHIILWRHNHTEKFPLSQLIHDISIKFAHWNQNMLFFMWTLSWSSEIAQLNVVLNLIFLINFNWQSEPLIYYLYKLYGHVLTSNKQKLKLKSFQHVNTWFFASCTKKTKKINVCIFMIFDL